MVRYVLGSLQSQVNRRCRIVDGQALVMALGRPSDRNTFEDLGDKLKAVLASGKDFDRTGMTFGRYRETSIKRATGKKHSRGHVPIRRIIEDGSVLLPRSWSNFVALAKNKADLARFLSDNLLRGGAPNNEIVIVGGGFEEEDAVKCSRPNNDISLLKGIQEVADT